MSSQRFIDLYQTPDPDVLIASRLPDIVSTDLWLTLRGRVETVNSDDVLLNRAWRNSPAPQGIHTRLKVKRSQGDCLYLATDAATNITLT